MKAIVLHQYGNADQAFSSKEVNEPILNDNQVKIKVEAFGLNYADIMARRNLYKDAPPLPAILGYEAVGIVIEQGKNVAENFIGKRVVAFTRFGSYAEVVVTESNAIVAINSNDDPGKMLALATQYCTAYFASHIATTIQPDDLILQHAAAGGVGLAMLEFAQLRGAKLIGLTSKDNKVEFLKSRGCYDAINYTQTDYAEYIQKKYSRIDSSFNSVAGKTFKKDLKLLNYGGRMVCYGAAERLKGASGFFGNLALVWRMGLIIPVKLLMQSQSLIGVNMLRIADHKPNQLQHCMLEVMALYRQGKINPEASHKFHVDEIAKAHALLESGNSIGKVWLSY